ncbi:hypothetical protein ACHAW5_001331 [Stephanodiscus triporus]|uniref:Diatom pyrenoid component 2 domain-containing protein n=1 Tax=Stephanodiscus triporus TaxID=2934178 RepID=A0ABD3NSB6_9STRA
MRISRPVGAALAILASRGRVDAFRCGLPPPLSSSSSRSRSRSRSMATRGRTSVAVVVVGLRRPPAPAAPSSSSSREIATCRPRPTEEEGSTTRRGAIRRCRDALLSSSSAAIASSASSASARSDEETTTATAAQLRSSAVGAELFLSGIAIFGMLYAVSGRTFPKSDDYSAARAKVVMIQAEPYGLDVGRRYYDGVYLRANDPVPPSDRGLVRSSCGAGVVDDGCAAAIANFLGEVRQGGSSGVEGGGPSEGQRETAADVLAYLDSLSSSSSSSAAAVAPRPPASDARATAFSSYLDGLSRGEIDAPASPRLVADYLTSLNEVRGRMIALESSVGRLPDEISSRLEHWQRERDEQLARELVKIEEFLIKNGGGGGGGMEERVLSSNVNGNYL